MNVTLNEIAQIVQGSVVGDQNMMITSLAPIDNIISGSLVFAQGEANLKLAEQSAAMAILVSKSTSSSIKPTIQVENPFKAFIYLLNHFFPTPLPTPGIHPTAVIAKDVIIGRNPAIGAYVVIESETIIGDNCVIKNHVSIGRNVRIGANVALHPQVTIYDNCQLGDRVTIHASTVIGSDGFGYTFVDGHHLKMPHLGNVVIEDDVEIGSNTVIDKASLGATIVGQGTKIDNLVQVAHSVKLGKHNILCAFTGIAGSTISGDQVIFAADVGVSDHVRIDDRVILTAGTGVFSKKHLREGIYYGIPARPKDKALEQESARARIPMMRKNLIDLSKKVKDLSQRLEQYQASKE